MDVFLIIILGVGGCVGSSLMHRLVAVSRGYCYAVVQIPVAVGFSFCRAWAPRGKASGAETSGSVLYGSWALRHRLKCCGCMHLVAAQSLGSSRDQGLNPCLLY